MSHKGNDYFLEALKEAKEEKPKDWQFLNWLCSKEPILEGENKITPIEETNL